MDELLAAPRAELLEFHLPFHGFLVLAGVIITPFTDGAAEGDEIVRVFDLCHMEMRIPYLCGKSKCRRIKWVRHRGKVENEIIDF